MFIEDSKSNKNFELGKKKFKHYIADYKKRRNVDCYETFPELRTFINTIK